MPLPSLQDMLVRYTMDTTGIDDFIKTLEMSETPRAKYIASLVLSGFNDMLSIILINTEDKFKILKHIMASLDLAEYKNPEMLLLLKKKAHRLILGLIAEAGLHETEEERINKHLQLFVKEYQYQVYYSCISDWPKNYGSQIAFAMCQLAAAKVCDIIKPSQYFFNKVMTMNDITYSFGQLFHCGTIASYIEERKKNFRLEGQMVMSQLESLFKKLIIRDIATSQKMVSKSKVKFDFEGEFEGEFESGFELDSELALRRELERELELKLKMELPRIIEKIAKIRKLSKLLYCDIRYAFEYYNFSDIRLKERKLIELWAKLSDRMAISRQDIDEKDLAPARIELRSKIAAFYQIDLNAAKETTSTAESTYGLKLPIANLPPILECSLRKSMDIKEYLKELYGQLELIEARLVSEIEGCEREIEGITHTDSDEEDIATNPSDSDEEDIATNPSDSDEEDIATNPSDSDEEDLGSDEAEFQSIIAAFWNREYDVAKEATSATISTYGLELLIATLPPIPECLFRKLMCAEMLLNRLEVESELINKKLELLIKELKPAIKAIKKLSIIYYSSFISYRQASALLSNPMNNPDVSLIQKFILNNAAHEIEQENALKHPSKHIDRLQSLFIQSIDPDWTLKQQLYENNFMDILNYNPSQKETTAQQAARKKDVDEEKAFVDPPIHTLKKTNAQQAAMQKDIDEENACVIQ